MEAQAICGGTVDKRGHRVMVRRMIYYLDNPEHTKELRRLAAEGGHTVEVAENETAPTLKLSNLRLDGYFRNQVTGDARVVMPEDA